MKFKVMEKAHLRDFYKWHKRYKESQSLHYLFWMMDAVVEFKSEFTALWYTNKINEKEFEQRYRLVNQMEKRVQNLIHELQCHINEMELELIYREEVR